MFDIELMANTFGNPSITMSPSSSSTKSQPNSPMSPMTPSKKDGIVVQSSGGGGGVNGVNGGGGGNESFGSRCKRKINFTHMGIPKMMSSPRGHQPATVARRNARERNRVKQVNNGFAALKQHIPLGHRSKKMSKVETLRCAVEYIKDLKGMLDPSDVVGSSSHFGQLLPQKYEMNSGGSHTSYDQMSPTSSEDPSSPSYASEGSYNANSATAIQYDCTENYEPVSPEDEELLECISWWQQS